MFGEVFGQLGKHRDDPVVELVGSTALLRRRGGWERCFHGLRSGRRFGRLRRLCGLLFASGGPPEQIQHLKLGAMAGVDEVQGHPELLVQDPLALLVFVAFHEQIATQREAESKARRNYIDEFK
jgi:hypothetical protein